MMLEKRVGLWSNQRAEDHVTCRPFGSRRDAPGGPVFRFSARWPNSPLQAPEGARHEQVQRNPHL